MISLLGACLYKKIHPLIIKKELVKLNYSNALFYNSFCTHDRRKKYDLIMSPGFYDTLNIFFFETKLLAGLITTCRKKINLKKVFLKRQKWLWWKFFSFFFFLPPLLVHCVDRLVQSRWKEFLTVAWTIKVLQS